MALNRPYLKVQSPTYEKPYRDRVWSIHYGKPYCKGHQKDVTIDYNVDSDEYLGPGETEVSYYQYLQRRYGNLVSLQNLQDFTEFLCFTEFTRFTRYFDLNSVNHFFIIILVLQKDMGGKHVPNEDEHPAWWKLKPSPDTKKLWAQSVNDYMIAEEQEADDLIFSKALVKKLIPYVAKYDP